jgi:hypothetical protein
VLVIGVPEASTSARPGILRLDEAGFDIEVPGALRAVRIDALQRRHVGGEGELAELLRLVDDDLVDADFRMVSRSSLRVESASSRSLQTLLQPLERLRETRSSRSTLVSSVLVELQLVLIICCSKAEGTR